MSEIVRVLSEIMLKTGAKQESLADEFGVSQATVSRWFSGSEPRGATRDKIYERARSLLIAVNVPASLLNDETVPVPLISWVSAGALASPDAVLDTVDAPTIYAPGLDARGEWIALKVEGTSMDRISPPGSVIFVNRRDQRLVMNACYVIAGENGEATYKRFRPQPSRFEPVSTFDHETVYPQADAMPRIIGRVRLSMIEM